MKDVEIIGMLKSYISKSLVGMGALKGANCQIESIAEVTGGQKITFLWIDTNNVSHRSELTVPNGAKGDPGDDGFSPSIVEDPDNTNDIYKLDITTKESTIVTPNLIGGIDSISVNGVAQTISNKAVNLDVASNLITEDQWTQIQALLV
jgi:tRNA uridine 5-carbamoylmethylation protein Kti12